MLGEIRSYDDLHALVRQRAEDLKISRNLLDEVAGFQVGYSGKLLAPKPLKRFGLMSLGSILGALGMKLLAVEDAEAFSLIQKRLVQRVRVNASSGRIELSTQRKLNRDMRSQLSAWAQHMNTLRHEKTTPEQRSRSARRAARKRWRGTEYRRGC